MEHLLLPDVLPFTIAGASVAFLGILMAVGSSGDGPGVDGKPDVPGDITGDGVPDVPVFISAGLLWFGLGKVPFSIFLSSFLSCWSIAGLCIQWVADGVLPGPLPFWMAGPVALLVAGPMTHFLCSVVGYLVPRHSSEAASTHEFIGAVGTLTLPCYSGTMGEIAVKDTRGNTHHVRVVPADGESTRVMKTGEDVLVRSVNKDGIFHVMSLASGDVAEKIVRSHQSA